MRRWEEGEAAGRGTGELSFAGEQRAMYHPDHRQSGIVDDMAPILGSAQVWARVRETDEPTSHVTLSVIGSWSLPPCLLCVSDSLSDVLKKELRCHWGVTIDSSQANALFQNRYCWPLSHLITLIDQRLSYARLLFWKRRCFWFPLPFSLSKTVVRFNPQFFILPITSTHTDETDSGMTRHSHQSLPKRSFRSSPPPSRVFMWCHFHGLGWCSPLK